MNTRAEDGLQSLSEKEKQTLRLIVRGHDAKSTARSLGLSVHTINERLRDARRKMAVSSSRQAARLLLEAERGGLGPTPDLFGDAEIGEDGARAAADLGNAPISGVGRAHRRPWIIIGVLLMTLALGLLALTLLSPVASAPSSALATTRAAPNTELVASARQWLALLDQGRWDESYQATGTSFRKSNTAQIWTEVSEKVRVPLGAAISRTFVSHENLPAPPHGYEVVRFRTHFANKPAAVETVTFDRENGSWRVVGVMIE